MREALILSAHMETTQVDNSISGYECPGLLSARGLGPTGARLSAVGGVLPPTDPDLGVALSAPGGKVVFDRGSVQWKTKTVRSHSTS